MKKLSEYDPDPDPEPDPDPDPEIRIFRSVGIYFSHTENKNHYVTLRVTPL